MPLKPALRLGIHGCSTKEYKKLIVDEELLLDNILRTLLIMPSHPQWVITLSR
jgi:hypothetical protein